MEISHELSLFIAFENDEWCKFIVRIASPILSISFFFILFFVWILLLFGFEVSFQYFVGLSILKIKQ